MADGASIVVTATGAHSIRVEISGLSSVLYDRRFDISISPGGQSSYFFRYEKETGGWSWNVTGLNSDTTYTASVVATNIDTGSVVWRDSDYDTTYPEADPVVMGSCSISPTKIGAGQTVTLSWSYTGSASTSSYFDIYASQTPTFSTATLVNSVRPPTTSVTTTWGNPGTWYFWVVYRGNSSRTTNYATLQVTENAWKQSTVYIYANGWKPATPYIFTNGQWRPATAYIYKE